MSEQSVSEGEARAAEIRRDVDAADARRAQEAVATTEQRVADAMQEKEKLSRRARRKLEKAQEAARSAEAARAQADRAAERDAARPAASVSGAAVTSPGIGAETPPRAAAAAAAPGPSPAPPPPVDGPQALTERPEFLVGAAFVGAFVFARVLKRLGD